MQQRALGKALDRKDAALGVWVRVVVGTPAEAAVRMCHRQELRTEDLRKQAKVHEHERVCF